MTHTSSTSQDLSCSCLAVFSPAVPVMAPRGPPELSGEAAEMQSRGPRGRPCWDIERVSNTHGLPSTTCMRPGKARDRTS
eukprot:4009167-Pyramimonas_sp.AAC.1